MEVRRYDAAKGGYTCANGCYTNCVISYIIHTFTVQTITVNVSLDKRYWERRELEYKSMFIYGLRLLTISISQPG